jgi:hypothetical protein
MISRTQSPRPELHRLSSMGVKSIRLPLSSSSSKECRMLKYRRPTDRDWVQFVGLAVLLGLLAMFATYFTGLQPP